MRNVMSSTHSAILRDSAADPATGLAVLLPVERTLHHVSRRAGGGFDFFAGIEFLTAAFDEFGFVIEQVALARAAVHEELDDALNFRWMMKAAVKFRTRRVGEQT